MLITIIIDELCLFFVQYLRIRGQGKSSTQPENMRRVGVLTASSTSGKACIQRLLLAEKEMEVRACFRSQAKKVECIPPLLQNCGWSTTTAAASPLEVKVGVDAEDISSLDRAMEGCNTAVIVTPLDYGRGFGQDAELSINMVRSAIRQGVERVIHVGSWTTVAPDALPGLSQRFLPTEEFLRNSKDVPSDLEWCVLRGGYFFNNLAHMFGENLRGGATSLAFPAVKIPPVDVRDIGEIAAELCLLDSGDNSFAPFQRRFLQCSGPSILSFTSIVRGIGDALGRGRLHHKTIDVEAWCEGKPPPLQELLRYMVEKQETAVPFDSRDIEDMETLLGRPLRGVAEWAHDHKALFIQSK